MARETTLFTEKEIRQIASMAGLGMPVEQIAMVLDVSKKTLERRCDDQPGVKDALLKGRAVASMTVRQTAFQMATSGKHAVMTIFWLKVREGWKDSQAEEAADNTIGIAYVPKSKRQQ